MKSTSGHAKPIVKVPSYARTVAERLEELAIKAGMRIQIGPAPGHEPAASCPVGIYRVALCQRDFSKFNYPKWAQSVIKEFRQHFRMREFSGCDRHRDVHKPLSIRALLAQARAFAAPPKPTPGIALIVTPMTRQEKSLLLEVLGTACRTAV